MPKVWSNIKRWYRGCLQRKGFLTIEVLLAATLFGFLSVAVIGAIVYGRQSTSNASDHSRAVLLAEEGLEAVRNIRDADFANLTDGTYGLASGDNQWSFSGSSDTPSAGMFTRQVTVTSVDSNRKLVVSTVGWTTAGVAREVSVSVWLNNWRAALGSTTTWDNAILAGSANPSGVNAGIKVATSGSHAYMVRNDGTPDFVVYDVSNPSSPTQAGSLSLPGAPTNIAVSGNYAYVTTSSGSADMIVVDIANPASPSVVATYNAPGTSGALGVYVSGTTAYITRMLDRREDEFLVVDISNPASPSLLGGYSANNTMHEVWVSGSYAYIATARNNAPVMVVDISNPASPSLSNTINFPGSTDATTIDGFGNNLLIGRGPTLHVVDISAAGNPVPVGSVDISGSGTINDIASSGADGLAFVATNASTGEFQVIDVSTPANPAILRTVNVSGALNGVAYNAELDAVAGASASGTQKFMIFIKD